MGARHKGSREPWANRTIPGRVIVYDEGRFTMSLCIQPTTWLPCGDIVLMHKLHIEGNEDTYLSTANRMRFP